MQKGTQSIYMSVSKKRDALAPKKRGQSFEKEITCAFNYNMSVLTPVNINRLGYELAAHPDTHFKQYLIEGLTHGFHTGIQFIPELSIECKNLKSATCQPNVVTELIETEVNKGYVCGPFVNIPFKQFRINPIGVAEGKYSKKKRLIVDLSAPHDDENNPSLNDIIDKGEFSLQYVTIDDAINLIKRFGKNSWLMKTDISDAFKIMPIDPALWPYHGIKWQNKYYFFKQLVFGSRSSPKIFDTISQAICWIASNNYNIKNILHLLDDFLVIVPHDANAQVTMETFLSIFDVLGIPLSLKKTAGPCNIIEYLGIYLDSDKMEARLPKEKIVRIQQIIESFRTRSSCTKRELLSLLGHLNFACRVIIPGRSFVSYLIALSTTVKKLHHHVKISQECRRDLDMWSDFLTSWNGVSFFMNDCITEAADMQLYTDATATSFGDFFQDKWFQGDFPAEILDENTSMAFFQLYPIVMACVLWGHKWNRKRILFHCDNMATVEIITKGRSKIQSIMKLVRKLTFHSATHHFTIHAKHITGAKNSIADSISLYQMQKFCRLAPYANREPTPCITPSTIMMY